MNPESLLVKIAERELGEREEGGENCGPRVREYQRATWLEPGPWPWCSAWTCWCIREWFAFPETRAQNARLLIDLAAKYDLPLELPYRPSGGLKSAEPGGLYNVASGTAPAVRAAS